MKKFILVLALLSTGCASIVSKSNWPVTVQSNPSGASVTITDESGNVVHTGVTPFLVTLSSKESFFCKADYDLEARLAGYGPGHARLSAGMNGWYWGNLIFGGLIGWFIVDPATGAMWKLRDSFTVNLSAPAP